MAESFKPITKNLSETTQGIEKLSSSGNKNATSTQPAMKIKQPAIEITRDESTNGVLYDTSLENTLIIMEKNNNFLE